MPCWGSEQRCAGMIYCKSCRRCWRGRSITRRRRTIGISCSALRRGRNIDVPQPVKSLLKTLLKTLLGTDRVQQALCGFLHQRIYPLEAACVIGVWHLAVGAGRRIIQKGPDDGFSIAERLHVPQILIVHRQDIVEHVQVFFGDETGLMRVVNVVTRKLDTSPVMRGIADMPMA